MAAKFTIGIPTRNRAPFLREALASATAQTLRDIEIVVSDNASTDDTAQVVRDPGDPRIRYLRNEADVGAVANFIRVAEATATPYFSWLQDDDAVHCEFAKRACDVFDAMPDVTVYISYAVVSPSLTSVHFPTLYGPPFELDWTSGELQRFDGKLIAPFSLMMSVAIPPMLAFRTEALCRNLHFWSPHCELYNERTLLAAVAGGGATVVDPRIGGFWRRHARQSWLKIIRRDARARRVQWLRMVDTLQSLMASRDDGWRAAFSATLAGCAEPYKSAWLGAARLWPTDRWLCREVKEALERSVKPRDQNNTFKAFVRKSLRRLTPSVLTRALERFESKYVYKKALRTQPSCPWLNL
jgi:glycosyltransferase involved in cell wall biosynthesis